MTAADRRAGLIKGMKHLAKKGVDCSACTGVCCTFVANSMQITPLEALDIAAYLEETHQWNDELKERLKQTIKRNRLDQPPPGDGKRDYVRRTYTCPFFMRTRLGCSLPPEHKPYGCLVFNPKIPGQTEGGSCDRVQHLSLEQRDIVASQDHQLGFDWEKLSIPEALLKVVEQDK